MSIKATIAGKILTLLGFDGVDFRNVRVDDNGYLVIKIGLTGSTFSPLVVDSGGYLLVKAGYDGTTYKPLKIDTNGRLSVDINSIPLPTNAAIATRQWYPESIVGGYLHKDSSTGGANWLLSDAVPAGKIWIITHISMAIPAHVPTGAWAFSYGTADEEIMIVTYTPTASQWFHSYIEIYLTAGKKIRFTWAGCTSGDTLLARYSGYQISAL